MCLILEFEVHEASGQEEKMKVEETRGKLEPLRTDCDPGRSGLLPLSLLV